jgi:hypothetical protein
LPARWICVPAASGVAETLVTVTFADLGGGRTRLTLRHTAFETAGARDDHRGGWVSALDRFTEFMAGSR